MNGWAKMPFAVRLVPTDPATNVPRVSFESVTVKAYSVGPSEGLYQEAPPFGEERTRNSNGLVSRPKVKCWVEFVEKTIQ